MAFGICCVGAAALIRVRRLFEHSPLPYCVSGQTVQNRSPYGGCVRAEVTNCASAYVLVCDDGGSVCRQHYIMLHQLVHIPGCGSRFFAWQEYPPHIAHALLSVAGHSVSADNSCCCTLFPGPQMEGCLPKGGSSSPCLVIANMVYFVGTSCVLQGSVTLCTACRVFSTSSCLSSSSSCFLLSIPSMNLHTCLVGRILIGLQHCAPHRVAWRALDLTSGCHALRV